MFRCLDQQKIQRYVIFHAKIYSNLLIPFKTTFPCFS